MMNKEQKKNYIAEMTTQFENSKAVMVTHYQGLTMTQLDELRSKMREHGIIFKITKNRITKLALEKTKCKDLSNLFTGPTAVAFGEDAIMSARILSNFAKDILIDKVNVKKDIYVIPTPVHESKFNFDEFSNKKSDEYFKILSVGRLIKRKGFIYLLKAFKDVVKSFDNVQLSIVGDGPEMNNINDFISKNKLEEKVNTYKEVSDQFLVDQYKSHNLFVLANLMLENGDCEGAPNVLIEAASFGLPTIAGIEGGTSDVVDNNKTGVLINPRDTEMFSEQIISFLKNREKCNLYGKNGYLKATNSHNKKNAGKMFSDIIKS